MYQIVSVFIFRSLAYIFNCHAFQVVLNVSFGDLTGMVPVLTWIQGTCGRELL